MYVCTYLCTQASVGRLHVVSTASTDSSESTLELTTTLYIMANSTYKAVILIGGPQKGNCAWHLYTSTVSVPMNVCTIAGRSSSSHRNGCQGHSLHALTLHWPLTISALLVTQQLLPFCATVIKNVISWAFCVGCNFNCSYGHSCGVFIFLWFAHLPHM